MEGFDIFRDIAQRTGGEIYIGVVGPVRTGKSTFIKRLMEHVVLPNIPDGYERARALDEMPQSGAGRTVMTVEPKFIPDQGVEIELGDGLRVRVRLVDSVGFPVPGALGYTEETGPRMVMTPWFDYEIPFEEAASVGTRKVIADHSTMGIVVTTDGSFGDLARESFVDAEALAIGQIRDLGKPFVILLNTSRPSSPDAQGLAASMEAEYGARVMPVNCSTLDFDGVSEILRELLFDFPVREVSVDMPAWVRELDAGHWLRRGFEQLVLEAERDIRRLREVSATVRRLGESDLVGVAEVARLNLGEGTAEIAMEAKDDLFHQVLRDIAGADLSERATLVRLLRQLVHAKQEYDQMAEGLQEARQAGYGIVMPSLADMVFEEPEMVRRGNQFGVRLKAHAPSLHLVRCEIEAEYTPILGNERQSADLVNYLTEKFEDDPQKIWDSQIFGRSLHDLLREGIASKLQHMPETAQQKLQETVQRIVNEGSGGLICIIL